MEKLTSEFFGVLIAKVLLDHVIVVFGKCTNEADD
jgi:hypothetical protein